MFDEDSFSTEAFSADSWWFSTVTAVKRYIRRLTSNLLNRITLISRF